MQHTFFNEFFKKDKLLAKSHGSKHFLNIDLMIHSSALGVISPEEP